MRVQCVCVQCVCTMCVPCVHVCVSEIGERYKQERWGGRGGEEGEQVKMKLCEREKWKEWVGMSTFSVFRMSLECTWYRT